MSNRLAPHDVSDIEGEFALELADDGSEGSGDVASEFEALGDDGDEREYELAGDDGGFSERFYELSTRAYESEVEVDDQVNRLLSEMEHEFFFGKLIRKAKKFARKLVRKAGKFVKGLPVFQVVKGVTQLARGNLRGMLGSLAKAALRTGIAAIPGGAAALPVLQGLGFREIDEPDANREAWANYVALAEDAYGTLAQNEAAGSDDPVAANAAAASAFQAAMARATRGRGAYRSSVNGNGRGSDVDRVVRLRPGERLVVEVSDR